MICGSSRAFTVLGALLALGLGALIGLGFAAPAAAAETLHGVVLSTDPAHAQAIVRHDAVGGMPAMTMPFRIDHAGGSAALRNGDTIDATLDTSTEPWTLRDIRITAASEIAPNSFGAGSSALRHAADVHIGDEIPGTVFIDQAGRPFTLRFLRGQVTVLAFVYTRCRDAQMCPLISGKFNRLQARLRGANVHLVEVSLDPAYDRPPVLQRYGKLFGVDPARWTLLTGDPDAVLDFAARFRVTVFADQRSGLIHPERTVIIDRQGRIVQLIDETSWTVDELAAAAKQTAGAPANPVAEFTLLLGRRAVAWCGNATKSFSGWFDLAMTLAIFLAFGWVLYRIARGIFTAKA